MVVYLVCRKHKSLNMHILPFDLFFMEPSSHKSEVLTSLQRDFPWCTITPIASRGVNQKPSLHKSDNPATLRHTPVWLRYSKRNISEAIDNKEIQAEAQHVYAVEHLKPSNSSGSVWMFQIYSRLFNKKKLPPNPKGRMRLYGNNISLLPVQKLMKHLPQLYSYSLSSKTIKENYFILKERLNDQSP